MPDWKRVKIDFPTIKLGKFIEPIKITYADINDKAYSTVYGVSNTEGITITGKESSKDISKYIVLEENCFAYNPYRINVGSIGMNHQGFKGCVSPAYVVFKTKNELNPYFLQHYLKSDFGNHLINWYGNRGGVRNALRYDDLCNVDIPDMDIQRQNDLLLKLNLYKNILALLNSENENQTTYLTLLRQSILQEAIEGKLTETWRKKNPVRKDDPEYDAAALLENIKAEKQKMIEEGKIRKEKLQESITEHSVSIPDSWERPILGVISKQITDGTHQTPTYVKDGKVFLSAQNVKPFKFMPENHQFVSDIAFNEYRKNKIPEIGDLLIGRVGAGIGETAAIDKNIDFAFYVSLGLVKIFKELTLSKYLTIICNSPYGVKYAKGNISSGGTSAGNYNLGRIRSLEIPLPPLAEQRAIVERVDQLLAMVDKLEKQVTERKGQAEELMQTVLREAFESN